MIPKASGASMRSPSSPYSKVCIAITVVVHSPGGPLIGNAIARDAPVMVFVGANVSGTFGTFRPVLNPIFDCFFGGIFLPFFAFLKSSFPGFLNP
jgi:hypothetical protein